MLLLSIQLCPETHVKTEEFKDNTAIWDATEMSAFPLRWKLRKKVIISKADVFFYFTFLFSKLPLFKSDFVSFR